MTEKGEPRAERDADLDGIWDWIEDHDDDTAAGVERLKRLAAEARDERDRWMANTDNATWKGMEAERESAALRARLEELVSTLRTDFAKYPKAGPSGVEWWQKGGGGYDLFPDQRRIFDALHAAERALAPTDPTP